MSLNLKKRKKGAGKRRTKKVEAAPVRDDEDVDEDVDMEDEEVNHYPVEDAVLIDIGR